MSRSRDVGTPLYTAPEIKPPKSMNPNMTKGYDPFKADVWSCGVTIFTMVFGMKPFKIDRMPFGRETLLRVEKDAFWKEYHEIDAILTEERKDRRSLNEGNGMEYPLVVRLQEVLKKYQGPTVDLGVGSASCECDEVLISHVKLIDSSRPDWGESIHFDLEMAVLPGQSKTILLGAPTILALGANVGPARTGP